MGGREEGGGGEGWREGDRMSDRQAWGGGLLVGVSHGIQAENWWGETKTCARGISPCAIKLLVKAQKRCGLEYRGESRLTTDPGITTILLS